MSVSLSSPPTPTCPYLLSVSIKEMTARNLLFPLGRFVAWRYLWHQESDGVCSFSSRFVWQSLLAFLLLLSGFGSMWTGPPCFLGNHPCSHQTDWTDLLPSTILLPVLPLSQAKGKEHKCWLSSIVKHSRLWWRDITTAVHRERSTGIHNTGQFFTLSWPGKKAVVCEVLQKS